MADESVYRERLTVSWWAWPAALVIGAFLATELAIGDVALRMGWTYAVTAVVVVAGLLVLSRIPVSVRAGELHVDDARLPLSAIGSVTVLDAAARRDLLGMDADPLAFVIQRPWIPGGVRIDLDDPDDPTPYWYISSRHPQQLADVLTNSGAAA